LIRILPPRDVDIEEERREIWRDLSAIYFKYDDETWRQAFRDVLTDLYEKIRGVRWNEIYERLYSAEKEGHGALS